jgi:hypothetical protein
MLRAATPAEVEAALNQLAAAAADPGAFGLAVVVRDEACEQVAGTRQVVVVHDPDAGIDVGGQLADGAGEIVAEDGVVDQVRSR